MNNRNQFLLGQYRPGDSYLHRLDPRTKITMVLVVMVAALIGKTVAFSLISIAVLLGLLLSCRLGWRLIARNLRPIVWFILFTALFHLLFSGRDDPEIVFSIGSLTVTKTGAAMALAYSARILIFVLATFILSLTTSPVAISEGIVSLLKPLRRMKVPVYDLGMILFIALRFIPVLADEIETIRKAQHIRGMDASRSLRGRLKRATALVLPVFFSALRRADELSVAIETRGYRSGHPRSSLHPLRFGRQDGVVFGLTALALVLVISARGIIR
ncbi:MAG: energy-coupling factor transporter transmembrane component T [candidate division Zixibacteria bacterium]|nr:energy-coupling factor transporter transmembrane component T [candidate division Zixibacteria bacterium]